MDAASFHAQLQHYYGVRAIAKYFDDMTVHRSSIEGDVLSSFFAYLLPSPRIHFFPLSFYPLLRSEHGFAPGTAALWDSFHTLAFPVCIGSGLNRPIREATYCQGDHFALFVIDREQRQVRVYDSVRSYVQHDMDVVRHIMEAFECRDFSILWNESYEQTDGTNGTDANECAVYVMRNATFELSGRTVYEEHDRVFYARALKAHFHPVPPPYDLWNTE